MHKKVSLQGWKKMIYVLLFLLLVVAPVMTLLLVVLALIVRIIPNSPLHSFLITTVVLFVVFITIVIITRIIAFTIATNSFQKGVVKTISTKVHWDIFMYAILFVPALFLIGQLNSIYIQGSLTYGLLVALLTTIQVLELHKIKK